MEAITERCCGLDVHQATVVACLLTGRADAKPTKEVRTFGTMTADLHQLRDWLLAQQCTHVAMESTGVYWKPVYAILEDDFTVVVGNARHIKNVPGRKTDVKDAEWIADLLRHGLIAKSFVPPKPIRDLRDLVRYRRKLVESKTAERNRLLKLLECANIKLASVASDVFGQSGTAMLRAILAGKASPADMAQLALGRLRKKVPLLQRALDGRVEEHHRFLLGIQLDRLDRIEADIATLDARIDQLLEPWEAERQLLTEIPGVDLVLAAAILAEIGTDMSVFKTAAHISSWAGVSPGNNESAGKRRHTRKRMGNVHLTTALVEAAQAAARTKRTYLGNKYHRLKARRGAKRATVAIAHKILVAAYYMLSRGCGFKELSETYLDKLDEQRTANHLVKRLERLGYEVHLSRSAA